MSEKPKKDKSPKGNIFKIVIIVLLSLIVVGGATFGGMYLASKKGVGADVKSDKPVEINEVTYSLDEFLVNLLDEDGRRYLKVKVFIGYEDNKDLTAEIELKKPIIRDVLNTSFRSKKTTDFGATGVDTMKEQLIVSINSALSKGKVSHIYFNDILVQ
ncbi:flagellar basal body-associated FliL family protein [Clostridium sp. CS001]|uniref:flagellar basal body-associated FliL family protein n=1 Tax=Clostridium sp. CS001 TaxID=2880648 RepID=UPI001CF2EFEB|nr:flagellar basal body-associated FliL family protein [Clostridium sp. CS001]MCB2288882.1 flagellar basal body-associated FliL family protein [Clostridium sp. CS001]